MSEDKRWCPKCGDSVLAGFLEERTVKDTGHVFLGCSNYPFCKYTEQIEEEGEDLFSFLPSEVFFNPMLRDALMETDLPQFMKRDRKTSALDKRSGRNLPPWEK